MGAVWSGGSQRGGSNGPRAPLGFRGGCTILSYDGQNAFHNMFRSQIFPVVASVAPDGVRVRGQPLRESPPDLLYRMEDGSAQVIHRSRSVPQGCSLGPQCFSARGLETLRHFKETPPVPGARAMAFIDYIVGRPASPASPGHAGCGRGHEMARGKARPSGSQPHEEQVASPAPRSPRNRRASCGTIRRFATHATDG